MGGRLYYVDWLRVSAFGILILYHCSVAFFPDMPWLMKSDDTSQALALAMDFPRAWRLALLFFISGMGTWFALRRTSELGFLRERAVRLGVPLLFAMCVVLVPQVWYERAYEQGYSGSLLTFWIERYFTEGRYPTGNFTWAHMWFVAYLLVMTAFCLPLLRFLIHPRQRWLTQRFERVAASNWVYLFFLLPLALNLALSPFFPRETNALYNDGAWFAVWTSWFGFGFLFARHHQALIGSLIDRRWPSAAFAAALAILLYRHAWLPGSNAELGGWNDMTVAYKTAIFALAWSMILTLLGFGALYLNRRSALLDWLNRRIFPFYIVHQTVIIAALYHVLPMPIGLYAKLALVVVATVAGSLAFCAVGERLPWPWRLLFGLPGKPRAQAEARTVPGR